MVLVIDKTAALLVPGGVENPAKVRNRPSIDLERNPWARVSLLQVLLLVLHPIIEKSGKDIF